MAKFLETCRQFRDGTLSAVDTPVETMADAMPHAEDVGMSADEVEELVRERNPVQRRQAAETDKEASTLLLDSYEGRWPKFRFHRPKRG